MKRLAKKSKRQLALPLHSEEPQIRPAPQRRTELITALADLLLEAIGAGRSGATGPEGGNSEREDHA